VRVGAGATERLTHAREKKLDENVVLVSFFLGAEISTYSSELVHLQWF
jgi:hypothetical protein